MLEEGSVYIQVDTREPDRAFSIKQISTLAVPGSYIETAIDNGNAWNNDDDSSRGWWWF